MALTTTTTLVNLTKAYATKKITPSATLAFITDKFNTSKTLNHFTHSDLHNDTLTSLALESSTRYASDAPLSLLDGVPVSIKSNVSFPPFPASASSKMLQSYIPPFSADVVTSLKSAGALLVGQTNMDEFGMGSATTNSATGPSINPIPYLYPSSSSPPQLSPGGSSGGSASSVAWRSSFASIGSDTGGSVRLPASHTNTTGFKPTYGSISRFGLIPYASSLDTIGLIAPTPSDCKILFDVLRGRSSNDPTSIDSPSTPLPPLEWSKVSVCLPSAYSVEEMPPSVLHHWNKTAELLSSLGANVEVIGDDVMSSSIARSSLAAYYVIACAEASSNLSKYDGVRYGSRVRDETVNYDEEYSATRSSFFGPEVLRRIECGNAVLSKEGTHYLKANILRNDLRDSYDAALSSHEFLLLPTTLSPPFSLSSPSSMPSQDEMMANDLMTVGSSLAGLPSISVPVTEPDGEDFWVG
eukprot:CAMPEP_0118638038 /NCGR_PEP_ID=MMETSP0785-20121206/3470_1 /TAXON_ID=91992 /ORGANISM="Bolidomonas pacifica, Strain CCMP 1866" /LENGTH=468 /DNA_ID=CAMNT_0006529259 /DNA_START=105 /DNA_END=1508 /DNA_ORIENTATION=-